MTILGTAIALFHYLLQMGVIPDSLAPCSEGISCTTRYIIFLNFVTIPFLSLTAFVLITGSMFVVLKKGKDNE
jgi:disulfide bond formation protein DsbB